jgi:predicted phage tail protein
VSADGSQASEGPWNPALPVVEPSGRLERILHLVPRILASKLHIIFLFALLVWIVFLAIPFPAIASARVELIVGNYTNVTSDLGACIAAGGTVAVVRHARRHGRLLAEQTERLRALEAQLASLAQRELRREDTGDDKAGA